MGAGTHARTPDMVASMNLGVETFLEFAAEAEAISHARAEELREGAWEALGEMAEAQAGTQAAEEPSQRFRELLTSSVTAGYAHIADAETNEAPDNAQHLGWRDTPDEMRPQGKRIGWLNRDGSLLLEPGAAFATVQRIAREQGTSLPIKQQTLWKRMKEKGLLAS
jgi:hypothetical protein